MWKKFSETGDTSHKKCRPKLKKIRTERNINTIGTIVASDGQISIQKLSNVTGISKSTVQRILRQDLGAFPYKVKVLEEIKPSDY